MRFYRQQSPINTHMDSDQVNLVRESIQVARLDVEEAANVTDLAINQIRQREIHKSKEGLLEKLRKRTRGS